MFKYIASIAIAALLLGIALRSRGAERAGEATPDPGEVIATGEQPHVQAVAASAGGFDFTVRHKFAGAVSRATLVYDTPNGETHTAATQTDCNKALAAGTLESGDDYAARVDLKGHIPADAVRPRLVLEDDTGTRVFVLESRG